MNCRRAALLLLAFALAIAFDSYPADADKRVLSKSGGGESAGMYSNYADDGSVVSRKYLGNAGVDVLSAAELMPALVSALDQLSKYHRPDDESKAH